MDADWLRQMSLQNANMALQQRKLDLDKAIADYQYQQLSKRINGGSQPVLDRLREEFENKSLLTIQNPKKIVGSAMMCPDGIRWRVFDIMESTTHYYFWLKQYEVNRTEEIGLSRVAMVGNIKMWNLYNVRTGNWDR
jgi:hypothetical protein